MIHRLLGACLFALLSAIGAQAQTAPGVTAPAPAQAKAEAPKDALGRTTPRGTVLGFLGAGRKSEGDLARQYLNTRLTGEVGEELAHKLFVVLDARLPARLSQVSDEPEGSRANPLSPNLEVVGTISTGEDTLDIVLERLPRGEAGPVWLFSSRTLASIPDVYDEIALERHVRFVPRFLIDTRLGGARLVEWVAVLIGLAVLYLATVVLNRILTPLIGLLWRRLRGSAVERRGVLPTPARLLVLALLSRWLFSALPISLLMRQLWSSIAALATIVAAVWLLMLLNGEAEQYIRRRLAHSHIGATADLLRLARRAVDLLIVFAGLLATMRHFAVDPTPALAGLGVGGIAVALAAQKTLENVIAGASLIFDQAVRVGDFLKMGDVTGTVDYIGLRSTRIRTLDRTVVSIPNGQIANATVETLSARDKFRFNHVIGLRYETTSDQLRTIVDGIRGLLAGHASVDRGSVRVRFFRLGSFSLDVDVFAYLYARDWNHFLEIQEELLFSVTEIVSRAGAEIAFPSQTMYVQNASAAQHASGGLPDDRAGVVS
ncbi:MAG TPA: mechanosensitive ion channel family protein [Vicinamibacterales bacterium]|nr:mechanosensitive ion channel family protein [Vicinamibacterales bacterium]